MIHRHASVPPDCDESDRPYVTSPRYIADWLSAGKCPLSDEMDLALDATLASRMEISTPWDARRPASGVTIVVTRSRHIDGRPWVIGSPVLVQTMGGVTHPFVNLTAAGLVWPRGGVRQDSAHHELG